jgi:oligopeptide transport system permease protein
MIAIGGGSKSEVLIRAQAVKGRSLWVDARRRLLRNRAAMASLVILAVVALMAVFAPLLSSYRYDDIDYNVISCAPDWWPLPSPCAAGGTHWFGTDAVGRDLFVRVLYGARVSLAVGLIATSVSLLIGVLYGAIAGYLGGRIDNWMMRLVDVLYALPFIFFVIILMTIFNRSLILMFVAIGAVEWLTMARIVRGQVMSLKKQEFIEAAIALGLRKRRIILRHIIPNVLGVVIVYATLTVPGVMLLEAFLSFLGLGVQPPMSSWGSLIKEGADWMEDAPWTLLSTGTVFSLTLFSLNFLGDGLRDALDVRASKD